MYIIVGAGGSGKSTLQDYLIKTRNYQRSVSTTTRPKRAGETDGIDYNFIDLNKFKEKEKNNELLCVEYYRGWGYGIEKNELKKGSNTPIKHEKGAIAVLTPQGVRSLRKEIKKEKDNTLDVTVVYLNVDGRSRLAKMLGTRNDSYECMRRFNADEKMFNGFENETDIIIDNHGYNKTLNELANEFEDKVKQLEKSKEEKKENKKVLKDREPEI